MKSNFKLHFFLIGILSLLFIILILLSTNEYKVKVDYVFAKDIQIISSNQDKDTNSIKDYSRLRQVKFGEINLTNEGFFPSKVPIRNFRLCLFENNLTTQKEVYLDYYLQKSPIIFGVEKDYVEIAAGKNIVIPLMANLDFQNSNLTKNPYILAYKFNKKSEVVFGSLNTFCQMADPKDLIVKIPIIIN